MRRLPGLDRLLSSSQELHFLASIPMNRETNTPIVTLMTWHGLYTAVTLAIGCFSPNTQTASGRRFRDGRRSLGPVVKAWASGQASGS